MIPNEVIFMPKNACGKVGLVGRQENRKTLIPSEKGPFTPTRSQPHPLGLGRDTGRGVKGGIGWPSPRPGRVPEGFGKGVLCMAQTLLLLELGSN